MKTLRRILPALSLVSLMTLSACDVLQQVAAQNLPLTQEEIIAGLKSALSVGADTAVGTLSRTNGYLGDAAVKILLPQEVQQVVDKLNGSSAGRAIYQNALRPLIDDMVTSLNRSAEDAAQRAVPIFGSAIRNMTIRDGVNILYGADTAATHYLRSNTYSQLFNAFQPSINSSLDKPLVGGRSANSIYGEFVRVYNQAANNPLNVFLRLESIDDPSLSNYVTGRALDGLFVKVAREEEMIREDPVHRVNDILKRVFGRADAQNQG
ncbi:MAG: DUF4197 domain-containing protein [Catalinimonas sp.]